jgi:hypothetical protein
MSRAPSRRTYIRGGRAEGNYLGVNSKTFVSWQNNPALSGREFLRHRIVNGRKHCRLADLDAFINPNLNIETTGFNGCRYSS